MMKRVNPGGGGGSAASKRQASTVIGAHSRGGSLWHGAPVVEPNGTLATLRHEVPRVALTAAAWDPLDRTRLALADARGNVYAASVRRNHHKLVCACGHGVHALLFSGARRGEVVAALGNRTLVVLDVDGGAAAAQTLRGTPHQGRVTRLAAGPPGLAVLASVSPDCVALWSTPHGSAAAASGAPLPAQGRPCGAAARYDVKFTVKTSASDPALDVVVTSRNVVTAHASALMFWDLSGPVLAFKIPTLAGRPPRGLAPADLLATYDCAAVSAAPCAEAVQMVVAGSGRAPVLAVFEVRGGGGGGGQAAAAAAPARLVKTVDLSTVTQNATDGVAQLAFHTRAVVGGGEGETEEVLLALSTSGNIHIVSVACDPPALLGTIHLQGLLIERFSVAQGEYLAALVSDTVSAAHLRLLHLPSAAMFSSFCSSGSTTAGGATANKTLETTMVASAMDATHSTFHTHGTTASGVRAFVQGVGGGGGNAGSALHDASASGAPRELRVSYPSPLLSTVTGAKGWIKAELKPSALSEKRRASLAAEAEAYGPDPNEAMKQRRLRQALHPSEASLEQALLHGAAAAAAAATTTHQRSGSKASASSFGIFYDEDLTNSRAPSRRHADRNKEGKRVTLKQAVQGGTRAPVKRRGGASAGGVSAHVPPARAAAPVPELELQLSLSDQAVSLNATKLRKMLFSFGQYPDRHRCLIWRFLLRLPNCAASGQAFATLLHKGPHPSTRVLLKAFPITDSKLRASLEKVLDCLCYHSKALSVSTWLPELAFPFAKMFGSDVKAAFECALAFAGNWGKYFLASYPHYSFDTVTLVQDLIAAFDPELAQILLERNCPVELYAWQPVYSVFTDLLSASEWAQVMDHVFSNQPIWFYLFLVSYLQHHKELLRRPLHARTGADACSVSFPVGRSGAGAAGAATGRNAAAAAAHAEATSEQFFRVFFTRNNPVDLNKVIQGAYALHRRLHAVMGGGSAADAAAAAAEDDASSAAASSAFDSGDGAPLDAARPKRTYEAFTYLECFGAEEGGVYPVLSHLPEADVATAVGERAKIIAQEAHLMTARRNTEEINRQIEAAEREHAGRLREMVHKGEAAHLALQREAGLHGELVAVKDMVVEQQTAARLRRVALQRRTAQLEAELAATGGDAALGRLRTSLLSYDAVAGSCAADAQRESMLLNVEESAQAHFEQSLRHLAAGGHGRGGSGSGSGSGGGGPPPLPHGVTPGDTKKSTPGTGGAGSSSGGGGSGGLSPPTPLENVLGGGDGGGGGSGAGATDAVAEAEAEEAAAKEVCTAEEKMRHNEGILSELRKEAAATTTPTGATASAATSTEAAQTCATESQTEYTGRTGASPPPPPQPQPQQPAAAAAATRPIQTPLEASAPSAAAAGAPARQTPAAPVSSTATTTAAAAAAAAAAASSSRTPALDALNRLVGRELLASYHHTRERVRRGDDVRHGGEDSSTPPTPQPTQQQQQRRQHSVSTTPTTTATTTSGAATTATTTTSSSPDCSTAESSPCLGGASSLSTSHEAVDKGFRDRRELMQRELASSAEEVSENRTVMERLEAYFLQNPNALSYPSGGTTTTKPTTATTTAAAAAAASARRQEAALSASASSSTSTRSAASDLLTAVKGKDAALRQRLLQTDQVLEENLAALRSLRPLVTGAAAGVAHPSSTTAAAAAAAAAAVEASFAVSSLSASTTRHGDRTAAACSEPRPSQVPAGSRRSGGGGGVGPRTAMPEAVQKRLDLEEEEEEEEGEEEREREAAAERESVPTAPFHNPFLNEQTLETVSLGESPRRHGEAAAGEAAYGGGGLFDGEGEGGDDDSEGSDLY